MIRDLIKEEAIKEVIADISSKAFRRLEKKGWGMYCGPHETYGIIAEEFHELMLAMHGNDHEGFQEELLDIAVACLIGMASYRSEP